MLIDYLENNIATSKEIQLNCDLTARQVLLQLNKLGSRIIKIPNGRSPKYALTTNAFGAGDNIAIWEVDSFAKPVAIALLRPLAVAGRFFIESLEFNLGMPKVFLGEAKNGLYDDLPYFLFDMAPKGFLGKKIAQNLAEIDDSYPRHLNDWKTEHIGRYLLANTDSSMGNLKFGNNVNLNLRATVTKHDRSEYLNIADDIIHSDSILTFAGGEQPKFTTFCTDVNAHVIIKFSPKGDEANARRWKDILITEHYANEVINQSNFITAAETNLLEDGDRLFLESIRFDLQGEHGKNSMLSLSVIDAEFVGSGDNWVKSAESLFEQKLLSSHDNHSVKHLAEFANLINNNDTHLGNISFKTHNDGFSLLPIYDMCSMGFAPKSNGEVTPFSFSKPNIAENLLIDLQPLVNAFWQLIFDEPKTSSEFKTFIKSSNLC